MLFTSVSLSAFALILPLVTAQAPSKSGPAAIFGRDGTYPRATRLSDNSLLGIYTRSDGLNRTLTTVTSTDNGATWSRLGDVDTGPAATKDMDNGFVHQLPSGRILAAFRNHDCDCAAEPRKYTFYRITLCESADGGRSWNYLSTPASDPQGPGPKMGSWEPFFQTALDGTLQLYYSRENRDDDQDSLLRRSTDGGKSWSTADVISGQGVTARDGMLGVARTGPASPGKLAVFESGVDGIFSIHSVRSPDDGASWNNRSLVYSSGAKSAGAPQVVRVGSRLVTSFGTNEDSGAWPVGSLKLVTSYDGGRTWGFKTEVHGTPAMWAGLLELDDDSFLALYESGGTSYAQRMVFGS